MSLKSANLALHFLEHPLRYRTSLGQTPDARLQRALAALPDLSAARLACSIHLDLKMVPLVEGLLERGAQVYLVTYNPPLCEMKWLNTCV